MELPSLPTLSCYLSSDFLCLVSLLMPVVLEVPELTKAARTFPLSAHRTVYSPQSAVYASAWIPIIVDSATIR